MTRVYAYTLVCDVYEWHGCHNSFSRARAGLEPDMLDDPHGEAAAAGWRTIHTDDMRLVDVCPVCWQRREEEERRRRVSGDTAWSSAESPVPTDATSRG